MWKLLAPWIFPVTCLGCARGDLALCPACAPGPGDRITTTVANVVVTAAGSYDGLLRRAIIAMKHGERAYLDAFAGLLADLVGPNAPLVPLPTSRGRRAARGFDQSIEVAKRTSLLGGCAFHDVLVNRGGAQRGRDRLARLESAGRFGVKSGAVVPDLAIVVDDVCTTGATLTDGILTLRAAGVAVIGAVVLARTPPGRNSHRPSVVLPHGQLSTLEE